MVATTSPGVQLCSVNQYRPTFFAFWFHQAHAGKDGVRQKGPSVLILLGLLLVLLFFGLGFALHALWILAIVLFVAWLIGLVIGRGENAGRGHFYRW
jgi:hypothetical protein